MVWSFDEISGANLLNKFVCLPCCYSHL